MVDFYADWCVSCMEMEHKTFTEPEVQAALKEYVLLQADVTENDDEDKALYVHFGIVGPPTIAFYGADGKERRNFRVVGFMKAAEFAAVVRQAVAPRLKPHSESLRFSRCACVGASAAHQAPAPSASCRIAAHRPASLALAATQSAAPVPAPLRRETGRARSVAATPCPTSRSRTATANRPSWRASAAGR